MSSTGDKMKPERQKMLDMDPNAKLTQEEMDEGWHWCYDWDQMLVGPGTVEADFCTCNDICKRKNSMFPHCNKCKTLMVESTAFVNDKVVTGVSDWPGEEIQRGQTLSVDKSTAVEVPCWKCPVCGHSITIVEND